MKKLLGILVAALAVGTIAWAQGALLINGAGASFPNPIYSKWFDEFHKVHSNAQINYQSVGSGAGIKQVTEGTVDFAARWAARPARRQLRHCAELRGLRGAKRFSSGRRRRIRGGRRRRGRDCNGR